jgi:hypothetical protein
MRITVNARTDWTESDLGDLSGTVAIVTGANSGLGFATSRHYLRLVPELS